MLNTSRSRSVLGTFASYQSQEIEGTRLAIAIWSYSTLFVIFEVSGFAAAITL